MAKRELMGNYAVRDLPGTRFFSIDMLAVGVKKHHVMGLVEIDVTRGMQELARRKESGEPVTLTAWAVRCISQAASEQPETHAVRKRRNLFVFDDVDLTVMVESELGGKRVPRPYLLRKANEKSLGEINAELSGSRSARDDGLVLGNKRAARLARMYLRMPRFLGRCFWRVLSKSPSLTKKMTGTVIVTSLGMFLNVSAWALPITTIPLCFALGTVKKKPGIFEGRIEPRDFLHLTIMFDHDVVDGAPAARFIARLSELMESAFELVNT
ncbi:MAG TPA: 2-oxo acid dehydrogenase subunit E2 [Candidatus Anoxymicrobiaceae bacterium]|jgi:pyruvate/2-oxoglutarate dehydrogenase complex dihydrolipoamide acyltransferase (E2) component